jgi:type II secretory pathway component GspD/PulD (secretin)
MLNHSPSNRRIQRIVLGSSLIWGAIFFNTSARSAEPKWPPQLYRYMVVDQDVRDVLTEFGRNIGVPINISGAVTGRRVRSEFAAVGAREFLQRLCGDHSLVWYFDGTVLHVNTESEIRTESVSLRAVRSDRLVARLNALGIADPRYSIRTTDKARIVSVSGPPPFLAMVRQTVAAMEKALAPQPIQEVTDGDEKSVRVFRGRQEGL